MTRSISPTACSGGMNAGVPTRLPAWVCDPASGVGLTSVHARVSSAVSASAVAGAPSPRTLASPSP